MDIEVYISKKKRLFLSTVLLVIVMIIAQAAAGIKLDWRGVIVVAFASYLLTYIALWEDVKGIELVTLFILPVLFSISVMISYFLLPVRWATRIGVDLVFGVLFYACLSAENIFNVAVIKTIQLLRVAKAISLFLSIITYFLIVVVLFSFHREFYVDMLTVFLLSSLFSLQNIWQVKLKEGVGKSEVLFIIVIALLLAELIAILSFWPLSIFIKAIFITGVFYSLLVLINDYFEECLFRQQIKEFCILISSLLLLIILMGKWGGG